MLMCNYSVNIGANPMKNALVALKKYLDETLNTKTTTLAWRGKKELQFFLTDTYDFFEIVLFDKVCLAMFVKNELEVTPALVRKHWEHVKNKWGGPCFYVQSAISSYNRLRLIKHHVPFVIPDKQIYLPDLGVDLHERFEKQLIPKNHFSPSTQAVLIYALNKKVGEGYTPSMLVKKLGYTHTTLTRVFNELEASEIGEVTSKGKERWWFFKGSKKDLWEQSKSKLRSPIKSRKSMKYFPGAKKSQILQSGISALADTTMINPPPIPVYAMGIVEYRQTNIPKRLQLSPSDEADLELEIWNYNPKLVSEHGKVDPFSLYLSLRETEDERVETSLEKMMEKIEW